MGRALLLGAGLLLGSASAQAGETLEFLNQPLPVVYNNGSLGNLQVGFKNADGQIDTTKSSCVVSMSLITKHESGRLAGTTSIMTSNGVAHYLAGNLTIRAQENGGSFRLMAEAASYGCEKHGIAISDIVVVQRSR